MHPSGEVGCFEVNDQPTSQPEDVVFAWDDIYAFYFFRADGTDDPAVMMFNYYDSTFDWKPVQAFDTLTAYFTDALRRYLNLD